MSNISITRTAILMFMFFSACGTRVDKRVELGDGANWDIDTDLGCYGTVSVQCPETCSGCATSPTGGTITPGTYALTNMTLWASNCGESFSSTVILMVHADRFDFTAAGQANAASSTQCPFEYSTNYRVEGNRLHLTPLSGNSNGFSGLIYDELFASDGSSITTFDEDPSGKINGPRLMYTKL